MKIQVVIILSVFYAFGLSAQTTLRGKVTDFNTGEFLLGATVIYGKGMGTATDSEGNYSFSIQPGERSLKVSYVGYKEISETLTVGAKAKILNFRLKTTLLNEVQVVA